MADSLQDGTTTLPKLPVSRPVEVDHLKESILRSTFGNTTVSAGGRTQLLTVPEGYAFESYELELKKVLACSTYPKVRDNLVWNKQQGYMAYTI
eukprot:CAMPEP_0116870646 /NCGR_PEP_ID=MMETSP0463-20121206/638_1 /TAXON_ID=181622 /ORGANISM="Strombidinopsis sp, Strain SopsisLIS2011" /LENGTH=93 /DNA_ID=CAMNT_0004507559 /DNA_START=422 /DNA_END=706 /DNA_ORIENTATION=+